MGQKETPCGFFAFVFLFLGAPRPPLLHHCQLVLFIFWLAEFPTKLDYIKMGTLILTSEIDYRRMGTLTSNLSTGGPSHGQFSLFARCPRSGYLAWRRSLSTPRAPWLCQRSEVAWWATWGLVATVKTLGTSRMVNQMVPSGSN